MAELNIINRSNDDNENENSENNDFCVCHTPASKSNKIKSRVALIKLIVAAILAISFATAEAIGGYFSHSLAILTDAAHMLSDFSGILISLISVFISRKAATKKMSFGFHRAEIMGAIISILIIWLVTGILVYEAINRLIYRNFTIEADIMLIVAASGLFVNVFMALILKIHVHHMEGYHNDNSSHNDNASIQHSGSHGEQGSHEHGSHKHSHGEILPANTTKFRLAWSWIKNKVHHKHNHDHGENINVRAAFIHCLGDIVQSLGVILAAYIIRFKPEWKIVDPLCTLIFAILVLFTTINIMRDAIHVLMEGTPKNISYEKVKKDILKMRGVANAHTLNIWSISSTRTALAAHVVIDKGFNSQEILDRMVTLIQEVYNIDQCTIQIEQHHPDMEACISCIDEAKTDTNKKKSLFKDRCIC